jgi:hypothetical protein
MDEKLETIQLKIFVNPLGTAKLKWVIPLNSLRGDESITIPLPSFKYDLPKIGTVPVPLSSKAISLIPQIGEIKIDENKIDFEVEENEFGIKQIRINSNLAKFEGGQFLKVNYSIPDIVNSDGVYFVFVYAFSAIVPSAKYDIVVNARLSYTIRKYKFMEWYFNIKTGQRLTKDPISLTKKEGDLVTVNFKGLKLNSYEELDIHLTTTRMPFFIRRDYFWIIIFIVTIILILSPIWSNFFKK